MAQQNDKKNDTVDIAKILEEKPEQYDLKKRPDRIGKYFHKYLDNFVFDSFTDEYIENSKKIEFMKGVPIPLRKEDLAEFQQGGLKVILLAENMAWIMGCDPHFKYVPEYTRYMKRFFNNKIVEGLLKEGRDMAELEDYDNAAIHLRAALCIDPGYLHALYSYAKVCRNMYMEKNNSEEYVGNFKAESIQFFEILRELHPRFAQSYYYLGYSYVNMGLYIKAQLTWEEFLKRSRVAKDKKEIRQRIEQLKQPVEIEKGYNAVLTGKWQEGIQTLEPYLETNYRDWWPLSYYLGIAYISAGYRQKAVERFKYVLQIHPSHTESMLELADIYALEGDQENEQKYRNKAQILKDNGYREKAFRDKNEEHSSAGKKQTKSKSKKKEQKKNNSAEGKEAARTEEIQLVQQKRKIKRLGGKKNETTDDRE